MNSEESQNESASNLLERPTLLVGIASFLASGLGVGLRLPAPGTFGAMWGLPLWLLVAQMTSPLWQIAALTVFFLLGIPICTLAGRDLLRRGWTTEPKDAQAIVWDEFATVPMVYAFAPAATAGAACIVWLAIGFGLHRLFDISKPWPCKHLEKLPDGLGVMADDLVAAFYAGMVYLALWQIFGAPG